MRILPINNVPVKYKKQRLQVDSTSAKSRNIGMHQNNNISFKQEFNYKLYSKAIETFCKMGIKSETIFLNKNIYNNLVTNNAEKFEANLEDLLATHEILEKILEPQNNKINEFIKTKNPNFNKFLKVCQEIKDKKVFKEVIDKIFTYINDTSKLTNDWNKGLDNISKLLSLRDALIKNIDHLTQFNRKTSSVDIDTMLFNFPLPVVKTLEVIGEKGFVYALNDKMDNLTNYIATIGLTPWVGRVKENLITLTNPKESKRYKSLKEEIFTLKQQYSNEKTWEEQAELRKKIATTTSELYKIQKNAIKDPKDILERTLIICELQSYETNDAEELLKVLNPKSKEEKAVLLNTIKTKFIKIYGLDNIPNIEEMINRLNLPKTKYIASFFKSKYKFRLAFGKFIKLFTTNLDKSPLEIYNSLDSNISTKKILEKYGVDYNKYTKYNPIIEVKDIKNLYKESTSLSVRMVDMNDILKSLTLGNESACCTKISGSQDSSAITYAKNKMFSAIEVLDGKTSVGNSMCYFALVDDKLSFILDNIELKREYAYKDQIRDAIIKCAREFTSYVSKNKKIPIYFQAHRQKVGIIDLPISLYNIKLLGSTGDDEAYIDFKGRAIKIPENNHFDRVSLHDVSYIADGTQKPNKSIPHGIIYNSRNFQLYLNNNLNLPDEWTEENMDEIYFS